MQVGGREPFLPVGPGGLLLGGNRQGQVCFFHLLDSSAVNIKMVTVGTDRIGETMSCILYVESLYPGNGWGQSVITFEIMEKLILESQTTGF